MDKLFETMLGTNGDAVQVVDYVNNLLTGNLAAAMQPMDTPATTDSLAGVKVVIEIPGVEKDDISLYIENNQLIISAERNIPQQTTARYNWEFSEIFTGKMKKVLKLPFRCDADTISAKLENGMLTVIIPKPEVEKYTNKISIK